MQSISLPRRRIGKGAESMTAEWEQLVVPLLVALIAGGLTSWIVLKMLGRGRRRPKSKELSICLCPAEQRTSPRRTHLEVRVEVSDADALTRPWEAVMMNCSEGGLRLLGDARFAVGTVLSVRGTAKKKSDWMRVQVRNCLSSGPRW